jgi:hypothetical protein
MDPRINPYSPGAGLRPAALTGRDADIDTFGVAMHRATRGRSARSIVLHGLRGVGKTVLLNELAYMARDEHWVVAAVEADHGSGRTPFRRQVHAVLEEAMRVESGKPQLGQKLKHALASLKTFGLTGPGGIGGTIELHERAGTGALAADFTDLVLDISEAAAKEIGTGVALFIDEMQHLANDELAAISQACHAANQRNLPFILVGAGLPNLPRVLSDAVSYAERLYDYRTVGRLDEADAFSALVIPAEQEGVTWKQDAAEVVLSASGGYPYFIQQFGQTSWNLATGSSLVELRDAQAGVQLGREMLDNGFFRARWDRATPAERSFMAAMAADGSSPSESGAVAKRMKKSLSSLGPARANLIAKGLVWAPDHGLIAFSVPGMAEFIERELARG